MAIYIDSLNINAFRGIRGLKLNNLNHFNIIAGDNNSGKTSILEAISLLKNPAYLYNVLKTSRMREDATGFYSQSLFDSFLNMLPQESLYMSISANGLIGDIDLELFGEMRDILIDKNSMEYQKSSYNRYDNYEPQEVETLGFSGVYKYSINSFSDSEPIEFTGYTRFNDLPRERKSFINISYLSPAKHLSGNNISNIVRSSSYKELCVFLLQLFDQDIADVLYIKNEFTNRPIECLYHKKLGTMPLSSYGDGIKKVLSMANGIAAAKDGILMIDEIETSIHSKYYQDIFSFLFLACERYNVQLFITTHSQEAIDALLATQRYRNRALGDDPINVITFRMSKKSCETLSRTMLGGEVFRNREKYDFEVRL